MATNLFDREAKLREELEIRYQGPSFDGRMELAALHTELRALENATKRIIDVLYETKKVSFTSQEVEIFIVVREGSFKEIIEIVFDNPLIQKVASDVISGCLIAVFGYFLGKNGNKKDFGKEVDILKDDSKFKTEMKDIVAPITIMGDQINITGDNNVIIIKQEQKEEFFQALTDLEINAAKRNGEFEETLRGTIRKLDLDAYGNNYFGFNIDNGPTRIPTSVKGEFNLNEYKELIDQRIEVDAMVKYRNDEIKRIEILRYRFLSRQHKLM